MRCSKCKEDKDEDAFHNRYNRRSGNGKASQCKECAKAQQCDVDRNRNTRLRREALTHYSQGTMKCACCGEGMIRFLCIDHVNNDGAEHRREIGRTTNIYRYLIKENFPEGYQVLCFNCNCGKAYNYGICPHKEI